jgi:hypothetical protein
MKLPNLLHVSVLLLASFMAVAPARAQQPPAGYGSLYVAAPGPVTMQLLADQSSPSAVNWNVHMVWLTGPGFYDYQFLGGAANGCSGGVCSGSNGSPQSSRFGREMAGPNPSGWSNNAPGTLLTSPNLGAGTTVGFMSQSISGFRIEPPGNSAADRFMMLTSGIPIQLTQDWAYRPAAIFAGQDNTARIGFNTSLSAPQSTNFLDYPIRILVGNVCLN